MVRPELLGELLRTDRSLRNHFAETVETQKHILVGNEYFRTSDTVNQSLTMDPEMGFLGNRWRRSGPRNSAHTRPLLASLDLPC